MSNTTAISKANQSTTAPVTTIFSNSEIKNQLATYGLEGLDFDHTSFPTISLRTSFEMSGEPDFDLKSFDVTVIQSLKKYILVDIAEESKKAMTEVKYSRDGINTVDGEPLDNYIAFITEKGGKPVLKRYLDLLVQLHTNDKHNQKLAVLSISPTSVSRVSGMFYQMQLQGQLENLANIKITVKRGEQRVSKSNATYYLWAMEPKEQAQVAA